MRERRKACRIGEKIKNASASTQADAQGSSSRTRPVRACNRVASQDQPVDVDRGPARGDPRRLEIGRVGPRTLGQERLVGSARLRTEDARRPKGQAVVDVGKDDLIAPGRLIAVVTGRPRHVVAVKRVACPVERSISQRLEMPALISSRRNCPPGSRDVRRSESVRSPTQCG